MLVFKQLFTFFKACCSIQLPLATGQNCEEKDRKSFGQKICPKNLKEHLHQLVLQSLKEIKVNEPTNASTDGLTTN